MATAKKAIHGLTLLGIDRSPSKKSNIGGGKKPSELGFLAKFWGLPATTLTLVWNSITFTWYCVIWRIQNQREHQKWRSNLRDMKVQSWILETRRSGQLSGNFQPLPKVDKTPIGSFRKFAMHRIRWWRHKGLDRVKNYEGLKRALCIGRWKGAIRHGHTHAQSADMAPNVQWPKTHNQLIGKLSSMPTKVTTRSYSSGVHTNPKSHPQTNSNTNL